MKRKDKKRREERDGKGRKEKESKKREGLIPMTLRTRSNHIESYRMQNSGAVV